MAQIDWEQDNLVSNMFPWASRLSARRSQPITNFLSADQLAAAEASADDMSPAQAELALMNYAANNPEPTPEPAPFIGGLQEWTTDQPINAPSTPIPGSDVLPAGAPTVTEKVDDFVNALSAKDQWLADTANSPAALAGFDPDVRWQLHQKDQDFQEARRTGTLDQFAEKYPDSFTAQRMNWDPSQGRRF